MKSSRINYLYLFNRTVWWIPGSYTHPPQKQFIFKVDYNFYTYTIIIFFLFFIWKSFFFSLYSCHFYIYFDKQHLSSLSSPVQQDWHPSQQSIAGFFFTGKLYLLQLYNDNRHSRKTAALLATEMAINTENGNKRTCDNVQMPRIRNKGDSYIILLVICT